MSINLIIYLIGCFLAFLIGMKEIEENEKSKQLYGTVSEPQYGLIVVVILMSWIIVGIWIYNKYINNK